MSLSSLETGCIYVDFLRLDDDEKSEPCFTKENPFRSTFCLSSLGGRAEYLFRLACKITCNFVMKWNVWLLVSYNPWVVGRFVYMTWKLKKTNRTQRRKRWLSNGRRSRRDVTPWVSEGPEWSGWRQASPSWQCLAPPSSNWAKRLGFGILAHTLFVTADRLWNKSGDKSSFRSPSFKLN